MWQRKQKKSEGNLARIKNTEQAIKHPDKKAMEWMRRKPYEVVRKNEDKEEKAQRLWSIP